MIKPQTMTSPLQPLRTTMRAAVLVDVDRLEMRDVPVQMPAPHEILVRVEAVGLCGTDLQIVAMARGSAAQAAASRPDCA